MMGSIMAIVDLTNRSQQGPQLYTCANCGRMIGALEQPYQWGASVVCPQCCTLLQTAAQAQEPQPAQIQQIYYSPPPRRRVYKDHLVGVKIVLLLISLGLFVGSGICAGNDEYDR